MEITDGKPHPLGSTYDGEGTNFSVFSSVADNVELCLFDDDGHEQRFELPGRTESIRHGYVHSIRPGQRYGFRIHGPWEPARGHLCRPDKLLLDPYCREVEGCVQWHDALFPYRAAGGHAAGGISKDGSGGPSMASNWEDSAPYMPKSVVVDSQFDWGGDRPLRTEIEDSVIYEVHVKGFTMRHPRIPPGIRGTYAGLAHPASIEHFMRLGVTALELLPVHQFIHRRRLIAHGLRNYWGYDPVCYFAPHNEYAFDRTPGGAVKEFKRMVKALHEAGIEVILDVVFNHTAEGNITGPVILFKGIDNSAYYWLNENDLLDYVDVTGTKNTLNCAHPRIRRLIIDSLRYWAADMHVDGFRFDLTPALLREGGAVNFESQLLEEIRSDPLLSGVKLIAEPWDIGDDGYQLGRFPGEWAEWNDKYRDDVRDYWIGRDGAAGRFVRRFAGSLDIFTAADGRPRNSINFITCHDGFTLHDLVSYQGKRNEANKENNRDGMDDNHAWNCGVEGESDDEAVNSLRARQKRNFIATLLLSRGVPMLLGGDELGRTQRGNNNAYCQDNDISWFDWEIADQGLLDFVTFMMGVRRRHAVFRGGDGLSAPGGEESRQDITGGEARASGCLLWYDAAGLEQVEGEAANSPPCPLQALYTAGKSYLILFNPTSSQMEFKPPAALSKRRWSKLADTSLAVQTGGPHAQVVESIMLTAHSLVVLVEEGPAE